MAFNLNLSQLIDSPTHIQGNILDLILTNAEELIHSVMVHSCESFPIHSDHYPITFKLSYSSYASSNKCHYIYDYSKANYEGMNTFLLNSNILQYLDINDVETVWSIIKTLVYKAMAIKIPKFKLRAHQYPKWFTPPLCHQLKINVFIH